MTPTKPTDTKRRLPIKLDLDKLVRVRGGAGITFPAGDAAAKDAA